MWSDAEVEACRRGREAYLLSKDVLEQSKVEAFEEGFKTARGFYRPLLTMRSIGAVRAVAEPLDREVARLERLIDDARERLSRALHPAWGPDQAVPSLTGLLAEAERAFGGRPVVVSPDDGPGVRLCGIPSIEDPLLVCALPACHEGPHGWEEPLDTYPAVLPGCRTILLPQDPARCADCGHPASEHRNEGCEHVVGRMPAGGAVHEVYCPCMCWTSPPEPVTGAPAAAIQAVLALTREVYGEEIALPLAESLAGQVLARTREAGL